MKRKLPFWAQMAATVGIRAAMSPLHLMGMESSREAALRLGELYPRLQPSRFRRAVDNLTDAYPDWPKDKIRDYAVKSYQHLFQLGPELVFAPRLITHEGFARHLILTDISDGLKILLSGKPCILITGHVGNWELIGYAISMLGFPLQAVYRPLDLKPLDEWVRTTRERRGLTLVSKFGAVRALPPLVTAGYPAALVADQSGGDRGLFAPFFGRLTSTYKSIGILAMQTNATLICGMARRLPRDEEPADGPWLDAATGGKQFLGANARHSLRYSVELCDIFGPDEYLKQPDPLYYLTARYRRSIETMVRAAPEQYFWMHRIWRSRPAHERHGKPFPPNLREKLASLPWMTSDDVERVVERSRLDALAIKR